MYIIPQPAAANIGAHKYIFRMATVLGIYRRRLDLTSTLPNPYYHQNPPQNGGFTTLTLCLKLCYSSEVSMKETH